MAFYPGRFSALWAELEEALPEWSRTRRNKIYHVRDKVAVAHRLPHFASPDNFPLRVSRANFDCRRHVPRQDPLL